MGTNTEWQHAEFQRIAAALPGVDADPHGSFGQQDRLDGWSDLDLRLTTDEPIPAVALFGDAPWAYEDVRADTAEVCRTVLTDGRRIDVSITGAGRIQGLSAAPDNDVRFLAAMAAAKLGRGDRLIGGHLTLELLRACLVVAMQLRDRDLGTTVHRTGGARDRYAELVMSLAAVPLTVSPRPNIVERAVEVYATWRTELDPGYVSWWSPLVGLIDRGLDKSSSG
ncbi:hypothetical protein [Microlunatus sp. Gsoil 973]|uniref:hypothetical protein n=1 Tax=Microlunatus sp. Gsoil 973 TaxID=2672569 RepID=UPI0012B440B0|nr:hypothetical protein [Microlunatus sp. Gsoil 973]QGN32491.1 hypothetical protein GJV80_06405 [Microlunatus sp. Gsoil 973]